MKKVIALVLTVLLIIQMSTMVMAHPEVIEKKTVDLRTDTIIVKQKGTAGNSNTEKTVSSYEITNITLDGEVGNAAYNMYSLSNPQKLGTSAILKVDISSVKYASDFNLKFFFTTGNCAGNYLRVYFVSHKYGEQLMNSLSSENPVTVSAKPNATTLYSDKLVYEYKNTDGKDIEVTAELSVKDSSEENPKKYGSVLEENINNAIKNGEKSVYLLIACVTPTAYENNNGAWVRVFTTRSEDYKPSVQVKCSTLSSDVVKTETGYKYTVENLKEHTKNAMLIVAAYDDTGAFITAATSGAMTATEDDSVDIMYADAASLTAYIWNPGTLEPITYTETVALKESE